MAKLAAHLERLISAEGPISVARYMAEALGHPVHGYYMRGDPLGASGDFITAPEISQIFGELIGLWCAVVWRAVDRPKPVRLVELGPGRGTLMADALRAARRSAPEFHAALDLHLVETSPPLRAAQRACLGDTAATWHDTATEVPAGPMLVIANEFIDALPVHQFVRTAGGWRERLVGFDPATGGFFFQPAAAETPALDLVPAALWASAEGCDEGGIVEIRPAGREIAAAIAARVAAHGGAALIVDYGHGRSAAGDTLQAVRGHRHADPLAEPGAADLTAHVDFQALGEAASAAGAAVHGPVTQGAFLTALGIEARRDMLADADPDKARDIRGACRRLIDTAEMGSLFKVLAIAGPGQPEPPGFENGVHDR
ncbi:MAG: class I SAM-dependent methyltransferase [Alphaproteobacteria bacterium]